jgi:hypothetical protein
VLNEYYNSPNTAYLLHHDAITGTCRDNVVDDYNEKIKTAEREAFQRIGKALGRLCDSTEGSNLKVPGGRDVTLYNPLNQDREELINLIVDAQYIEVRHEG